MPDRRTPGPVLPSQAAAPPSAAPMSPRPPSDRGQGRHPFTPTAQQRRLVMVLRGAGLTPDDVAREVGTSRSTLYKHFKHELDHGRATVVARIGAKVVQKALAGDNAMIQFYLRCHGGPAWRDTQRVEHTGPDGAQLAPPDLVVSFLHAKDPSPPK